MLNLIRVVQSRNIGNNLEDQIYQFVQISEYYISTKNMIISYTTILKLSYTTKSIVEENDKNLIKSDVMPKT